MAEDQSVNGDKWNSEATNLFSFLGWKQTGDCNIDLEGSKGETCGVDTLFKYEDPLLYPHERGLILESKRYKTTSYSKAQLEEWINRIDKKIIDLKYSENFLFDYPEMESVNFRTGLIAIWFHDVLSYNPQTLINDFKKVHISHRNRMKGQSKIYVISNDAILKLCSICYCIREFNFAHKEFKFYYPSSNNLDQPSVRSKVLSINYIFSKFMLGEIKEADSSIGKVVFYFGDINQASFINLKKALLKLNFLDVEKKLIIYTYKKDSHLRKIENNIINHFGLENLKIEQMENFQEVPSFISNLKQ